MKLPLSSTITELQISKTNAKNPIKILIHLQVNTAAKQLRVEDVLRRKQWHAAPDCFLPDFVDKGRQIRQGRMKS